ncbi:MAG: toll/interleukin-1 receptor domain-containing protein [Lachnospiraceae bacterium]|nr:toll/interleukin-1 receptor domain-containing protein [Lachnospiraceae bacterium]
MYIFISHSSKNAEIATNICNILEANGSECFIAPRNIRSGYEYAAELINGIDRSDVVLLLLSEEANTSPHILREIERAVSKSIPIIVYKLENITLSKSLEYFLMTHQWLDYEDDNHEILLKCIDDLKNNTSTAIKAGTVNITTTNTSININETKSSNIDTNNTLINVFKKTPVIIVSLAMVIILTICITLAVSKSDNSESKPSTENNTTPNENTYSTTVSISNVELGNLVTFGKYNEEDINWYVINIDKKNNTAILLSKHILSFKAFSGAESGTVRSDGENTYMSSDPEVKEDNNLKQLIFGNNSWETSDIRVWLNSKDDNVKYDGYGPIPSSMSEHKNSYNLEPGFLSNFSLEELKAIKDTTITTKCNSFSPQKTTITTDKVFFLSKEELKWLDEANVSYYATPTEKAISKNQTFFYRDYCLSAPFNTESCPWWLREPLENSVCEGYLVSHVAKLDDIYYTSLVSVEEFGIRPAMTVDLNSDCIKIITE